MSLTTVTPVTGADSGVQPVSRMSFRAIEGSALTPENDLFLDAFRTTRQYIYLQDLR